LEKERFNRSNGYFKALFKENKSSKKYSKSLVITFHFGRTESRAQKRRKGKKPRSKRLKTLGHEDPDIAAGQKRHGSDNVHIIQ